MNRAYAVLHVKALDPAARTFSGIASTPNPDRRGDIVEPLGATFHNPVPLLLHHDTKLPVGDAVLEATADGIAFRASFPTIDTPGPLRDRVEEAWQSVSAKLIRGVSIGIGKAANAPDGITMRKGGGGLHFKRFEIAELSLVTIPANVDATILRVMEFDAPHLAASGRDPAGVSALPVVRADKAAPRMAKQTTSEQIQSFEHTRAAKAAAMAALMETASEKGETLDAAQTEEYDGLELEVKSIDEHLVRLRAFEKTQIAAATPPASALVVKSASPVITVKANVPAGTAFVRAAMALMACRGNRFEAAEYAKQWEDTTPEVGLYLKAAVSPGNTTTAAWAGALVNVQNIASEFIELSRPKTILGKIPGLRQVPFNAQVPVQTGGGTYGWVGQAKAKPVTALAFSTARLDISKAAGIIVLTEELVKTSSPSAEAIVRADMIAGIAQFLDQQFIDPAVAAVADTNPASITNGLTPITSADDPMVDLYAILSAFSAANIPIAGVTLIMSETNALGMGMIRDAQGNRVFPNMGPTGGSAEGITIVTSNTAGTNVVALQPSGVLYADEGRVEIDVSREASVQMDSAPDSPATATTVLRSLWQENLVGLRAERWINWKRAQTAAVQLVTGASYAPAAALAATRNGAAPAATKSKSDR